MNLDNSSYNFTVGTGLAVEVTNSVGTYIPIFGGYISDFTIGVNRAGIYRLYNRCHYYRSWSLI
jgi:hypothetical protein